MEVLKLIFICIVSASFGEEINNAMKLEEDQDKLFRPKRGKVQPKDGVRQKLDLNHIITKKTQNQVAPKRVAPKTDYRIRPQLNALKSNVHHPIVRNPIVKEEPVIVPKHTEPNNTHREGFFIEDKDDIEVEKKAENKADDILTTAVRLKPEHSCTLATQPSSSNKNVSTAVVEHTENDSTNTTNIKNIATSTKQVPKHYVVEGETEKDPLTSKLEKIIQNDQAVGDLNDVIDQLPDIITKLLKNRKKKSKSEIKNNHLTSIPVKTNKSGNDLNSDEDINEINPNNFQNESIDSIKITQQNYTEINEKTHTPKFITEHDNKSHKKGPDHSTMTGPESIHSECSLAEIIKPPENYVPHIESPSLILVHENLHDVSGFRYQGGSNLNKQDYDSDLTFINSPFIYPTKENTGAYTYKVNNDDNGKSVSVEDDERNITWKTWSNTELLIKTANNNRTNNEMEAKPVIPRRQEPIITIDKPSNNCYQKPLPASTNYYQRQPQYWFNDYFHPQNQICPRNDVNQLSYINYYNNIM